MASCVLREQHVEGPQDVEALNFNHISGSFLSFCEAGFFHLPTWPWMTCSAFEAAG